jgi:nitrate/nitrite transporter NarK
MDNDDDAGDTGDAKAKYVAAAANRIAIAQARTQAAKEVVRRHGGTLHDHEGRTALTVVIVTAVILGMLALMIYTG